MEHLSKEIERLIDLLEEYETDYKIPGGQGDRTAGSESQRAGQSTRTMSKRKRSDSTDSESNGDQDPDAAYEETLHRAFNLAKKELDIPPQIEAGLGKWVVKGAYFLVQVKVSPAVGRFQKLIHVQRFGPRWYGIIQHLPICLATILA